VTNLLRITKSGRVDLNVQNE